MKITPLNRHLLVGACSNPNKLVEKSIEGSKIAVIEGTDICGGLSYGKVLAIDPTPRPDSPDFCNVGDVVYWRKGGNDTIVDSENQSRVMVHEAQVVCMVRGCEVKMIDTNALEQIEKLRAMKRQRNAEESLIRG